MLARRTMAHAAAGARRSVAPVSVAVGTVAAAARCTVTRSASAAAYSTCSLRSSATTAARCLAPAPYTYSSSSTISHLRRPLTLTLVRRKSCGIVGLPNVGKSTLFNALTDTQNAQASNYPFCTIEPNVAQVAVPDPVLVQLAKIAKTDVVIFNQVRFVDIAGIIKGASEGAGLGNKFLQNIRDVDVLLHVVRCFDNPDIIHVESTIDPIADMDVIETELLLADLQTIEKRIENAEKSKKKDAAANANVDRPALYRKIRSALNQGVAIADVVFDTEEERNEVATMQLITSKPMAYVCNVDESSTSTHNKYTQVVFDHVEAMNKAPAKTLEDGVKVQRIPRACLRVCSQLESEVQSLGTAEARSEFLAMNNMTEGSLNSVIQTSNRLLKSESYYTVGVQEARAWGISAGTNAQAAAGKIHSDLSKGFVCAEVIKPVDMIRLGSEAAVREAGLMKTEGKTYIVQDGDILLFRVSGQKGR